MAERRHHSFESDPVTASAPCRIDVGGTLDLGTFYMPLRPLGPLTINMAIALRTRVRVSRGEAGRVSVVSRGFSRVSADPATVPFDGPMGLILAVAATFGMTGMRIDIDSASPPRSALGGSSVAAVALVAALAEASGTPLPRSAIARIAHAVEGSVAGVVCGRQDQLAAAYGGVHAWHWGGPLHTDEPDGEPLMSPDRFPELSDRLLLAYGGVPHESRDINGQWVRDFISGRHRNRWVRIIETTRSFADHLRAGDYDSAARAIREETAIRREMTPAVIDDLGARLVEAAEAAGCGARFTGAGGGGCLFAIGTPDRITALRPVWENLLAARKHATLLPVAIDAEGVTVGG